MAHSCTPSLRFDNILWTLTIVIGDTPRGSHRYAAGTPTYSGDRGFLYKVAVCLTSICTCTNMLSYTHFHYNLNFMYRLLITLSLSDFFLLIEDRTLHSLQVGSDEASVLEFC